MEISNAHHNKPQAMSAQQLEQVLAGISFPNNMNNITMDDQLQQEEKKVISTRPPNPEHSLKCPRCESTNTKFCYYNNYSLSQPRYFCKACRRYWTQGGSLRNVPVGGGCRKNTKRISSTSSSNSSKKPHQPPLPVASQQLLPPPNNNNDLSLAAFLNPGPANFLDALRYGGGGGGSFIVDSGTTCDNNMLFPFEGGHDMNLGTGSETVAEGSWRDDNSNVGIDAMTTRDYWNGVGSSYWHGVINSSNFM